MFDKTVTIFNRQGNTWYPRVCTGVQMSQDIGYIQRTFGATDNATIAVHFPIVDGKISDSEYLNPKAWKERESKDGVITAKGGEEYDIIYIGGWANEQPIADGDYPKGFYHYMRTNEDGVYAIASVSEFWTIPHIEVAAR